MRDNRQKKHTKQTNILCFNFDILHLQDDSCHRVLLQNQIHTHHTHLHM